MDLPQREADIARCDRGRAGRVFGREASGGEVAEVDACTLS